MADYDLSIHTNPDARAWAKFFVETTKDMPREHFADESYMVAWFANAMMAMYDAGRARPSFDEALAKLRAEKGDLL